MSRCSARAGILKIQAHNSGQVFRKEHEAASRHDCPSGHLPSSMHGLFAEDQLRENACAPRHVNAYLLLAVEESREVAGCKSFEYRLFCLEL